MASDIDSALVLRLEATLSKFEKQMDRARKAARSTTTGIQSDFDRTNKNLAAGSSRAASAMTRFVNISGRGRFVLQNTANQIGDVAVQLQGGAGAARVMSQQMPQLLGGFGALGGALGLVAPLLGTLAAIGIPVAAMLLRNGEAADDAQERIKAFEKALSDAEGALGRAEEAMELASSGGLETLLKRYGQMTEAVRTLNEEITKIHIRAAKDTLGVVVDQALGANLSDHVSEQFGKVGEGLVRVLSDMDRAKERLRALREEMRGFEQQGEQVPQRMTNELVILENSITDLETQFQKLSNIAGSLRIDPGLFQDLFAAKAALEEAQQASDFSRVADEFARLREIAQEMGLPQDLIDQMTRSEDLARQMQERLGEAAANAEATAGAAGGIGAALQPGVAAAAALADNLGISLQLAQRLSAMGPQGVNMNPDPSGKVYGGRGGDPRDMGGSFFGWQTTDAANWTPPKTSRGGGGGGGGGGGVDEIEKATRAYEALRAQLDPAFASFQKLKRAEETLNEAREKGIITQEEYNAVMAQAEEQFNDTASELESYAQKAGDFMADLGIEIIKNIDNLDDLKKAVGDFVKQALLDLARLALSKMFTTAFSSILGVPMGGGMGGLGGGLFGGFRASGGPVAAGKAYVVGERQPELFVPNTSGKILPSVPQSMGGSELVVNITGNIPRGAVRQQKGRIDIEVGQMVVDVIASGAADQIMRQKFGLAGRGQGV